MLSRTVVLAAIAILSLSTMPAEAGKAENTLRSAQEIAVDTIDPYYSSYREVYVTLGEMIFDTLIYEDPRTRKNEPLLAKEWKWLDDVTLLVTLRDDVKWHDGNRFTADDVVYTLGYVLNKDNAMPRLSQVSIVSGAEKIGDYEVKIKLRAPYGAIMPVLASRLPILPQGFYGKDRTVAKRVGTGPYKITSHTPGAGAVLRKNDQYFDRSPKGKPSIETFEYVFIPETSTQIAELMAGNIDWIWRVSDEEKQKLGTLPDIATATAATLRNNFLVFDVNGLSGDPYFKDPRVRQAVAHAIDRKLIVQQLVRGGTDVLHQPCHSSQFGCPPADALMRYEFDPKKAKALLADAGYPNGFDTTLWFFNNYPRDIAQALQANLQSVGIRAKLNPVSPTVMYESTQKGVIPFMWLGSAAGSILDVDALWGQFFGTGRDITRDSELTGWVKAAANTVNERTRLDLYTKAGQRIVEKLYWLPMFMEGGLYVYKKELDFKAWDDENPRFYFSKWRQ